MAATDSDSSPPSKQPASDRPATNATADRVRRYWPGLTAFVAAVGAVGGAVLYLVGTTVSQTYFRQWGLSAAMFPSSTDQAVVLGYHALTNELAAAFLRAVGQYLLWLVAYAVLVWFAAILSARWESRAKESFANALQQYEGPFRVVAMLLVSLGLVVIMPLAVFVTIVFLFSWPLTAADAYGKQLVVDQLAEYKQGCDNASIPSKCITLVRGTEAIARGFLIGSTDREVALFDPAAGRTVLMERNGLMLTGQPRGVLTFEKIKAK